MNDEPELPASAPIDVRNVALTLLAVLASVVLLQQAQVLVIPIVLGLLISYALYPLVSWLASRRVPRPAGAAIVLLMLVGLGGFGLYQLRAQVDAIVQELPAGRGTRRLASHDTRG
jgi:predicted PurR-regulated permease PerM